MATIRPISPHLQHTLDSAISLAREMASKSMGDSSESSPKTPNSQDKKRFTFKLKGFHKSFSGSSQNIQDIETCEEKQAYKSLIEKGFYRDPYQSSSFSHHRHSNSHHNQQHHHHYQHSSQHHNHHRHHHSQAYTLPSHSHSHSQQSHSIYANDEWAIDRRASFSMKKSAGFF